MPTCSRFVILIREFGLVRGVKLWWRLYRTSEVVRLPYRFPKNNAERYIALRGKSTDFSVFRQVVLDDVYAPFFSRLSESNVRTIVDAGAHIGLSALMLHARFPNAKIIAIEPDSENFSLLVQNVSDIAEITCIHSALWSSDTHRMVKKDKQGSTWGNTTESPDESAEHGELVVAKSLPTLMRDHNLSEIDLLKLDIEGAEREVLGVGDLNWLSNVRSLVVEVHERMYPGCEWVVRRALENFKGELCLVNE